jgi:predicted lipoprotein with Yx(FWY)xxD motif
MHVRTAPPAESTPRTPRRERRRRAWVAVPFAVGIGALTAACGPSYAGTSAATSNSSTSASAGTGALVATAPTGIGTVVVDHTGRTVYEFANDTGTTSTCTGECASDWPPVIAPATLPATVPGVSGALGSTERSDGSRQLTVAGHPVYTYEGDSAPGQTHGNGITLNGGLWTAVSADGSPLGSSSGSTTY